MSLEEACLILRIEKREQLKKEFIMDRFSGSFYRTKVISPYLAERMEDAKSTLLAEIDETDSEDQSSSNNQDNNSSNSKGLN